MWWRPTFIRNIFFTLGIAVTGTMILLSMMLLPSIVNGPSRVNYLQRSECIISDISYIDNLCFQNTNFYFSNLDYSPHWNSCILVEFNITNSLGVSCKWIFTDFFTSRLEAFIAVSRNYQIGTEYKCVVDTINNVCFEDQHEVLIYVSVVVSLFVLSCLVWGLFVFLSLKYKRRFR